MFLLTVKNREATFVVLYMIVDTQLRERDMEGFCDDP